MVIQYDLLYHGEFNEEEKIPELIKFIQVNGVGVKIQLNWLLKALKLLML